MASYYVVRCRACHQLVPLIEFFPEFSYKFPDMFTVVHKQHVPSASCDLELHYDWHNIRRAVLAKLPNFKAHSGFEKHKKAKM
jgi:hypothetical protein